MKNSAWSTLGLCVVALLMLAGCQTVFEKPPMEVGEVIPAANEEIILNDIILIADVSGSMYPPDKFAMERSILQSFVAAMPAGHYNAGMMSFGGEWEHEWLRHALVPFNRHSLAGTAAALDLLRGYYPLVKALDEQQDDLCGRKGRTALVVFSDGKTDRDATLAGAKYLQLMHGGQLCIYTVHFGKDQEGAPLLQELASSTGCGGFWWASEIASPQGLEDMVREIFYGKHVDSDGDGVYDKDDECPNTPKGAKVDERGCWVLANVRFDTDKSIIKAEFKQPLDEVAKVLAENPGLKVRIDGHTDSTASQAYNQKLSERRAHAVRRALVERGIDAGRMKSMGFGETRPARPNNTAANRYMNRRVEITPVQ